MDWTAALDIYCERTDAAFWSEPLNAVSNVAFVLAALWAAVEARRRGITRPGIWLPIVLAFCIGVGSFLFHTYATVWAAFADTLPIWAFVASYALIAAVLLGRMRPARVALIAALVVGAAVLAGQLAGGAEPNPHGLTPRSRFNGSEQYLPAVVAMLIFSAMAVWRRHPVRGWFVAATAIFALSLGLRTLDISLCPVWPYGTHVFWHLLNGTMIALLLQGLIRHTRKAPAP